MNRLVQQELEYRRNMWNSILSSGGPERVQARLLRELRIYRGAAGIWYDKPRTSNLTGDGNGVTVSLLHTGRSYADDLFEDGVDYHYPSTNRRGTHDSNEIEATKSAGRLRLPVFVITYPSPYSTRRSVHFGWVEGWNDESKIFTVTFDDDPPSQLLHEINDNEPFKLVEPTTGQERRVGRVTVRPGQRRFRFEVGLRYGIRCAVCGIDVQEVLDAAHIRPKNERGSDDPRNGLFLCALHHRALEKYLFTIEPNTLKIHFGTTGMDADTLRVTYSSLGHLPRKPHKEALEWHWNRWIQESEGE